MPKKTTHYTTGAYPACGNDGRWTAVTSIPDEVTCKSCLRSTSFRKRHPDYAIEPTGGGRPPKTGGQCTFKVYLQPDLKTWLKSQKGTMASTIVTALEEKRARQFEAR